jgi:hypothetical protein
LEDKDMIANAQRFVHKELKAPVKGSVFPPEQITYLEMKLECLGVSNKKDLMPPSIDTDELARAVTYGKMDQFIYTEEGGDLYDVCMYQNEHGDIYIYGVRTRNLPEKTLSKKKKEGE